MENIMATQQDPEMLEEYDFTDGVRGKYIKRLQKGANIVKLDDDVVSLFPDAKSVNEALRALGKIIQQHQKMA